jgi:hypothetical protein
MHSAALALMIVAGFSTVCISPTAYSQSNISGDLSGTVADASGATVPNAQVTVTSVERGNSKVVTTDAQGNFRVPLLSPGKYNVSVAAPGFATATAQSTVSAGVTTPLNFKLTVGQTTTTVEVTADAAQLLHVDDAQISTTFDLQQIQMMPNPGNDLTFVAQTAPGAVMNTQGGYGNFSTNGLPATSNTFTVNGGYEGDPYLNLNNSGATNLLLGNNDVDTVTVTTNSYDAAFGGLGGAQVNEISRSGSNRWHGNLGYWWNGRAMNANSYFNKQAGDPRNFTNANQWAAAIGGPIKRDKIFGFVDTEGLRVIIPVRGTSYGPSPDFQSLILGPPTGNTIDNPCGSGGDSVHGHARPRSAIRGTPAALDPCTYAPYGNLADNGLSSESSLYQAIFKYYNNAPGWAKGGPDSADGDPATWVWNGQSTNFGREWLINGRVDFNLRDSDHLYIHFKDDHGTQPTATSFIDPIFDAESPQPSYEGQLNETHTFTPNITNQFLFSASYYRAIFTNTRASELAKSIPFVLIPEAYATAGAWDISGNAADWIGNIDYALPQGRNVTGYQFGDDLTWLKGRHNWKFGYAFRRNDITDYTSSEHNINFAGGENIILDPGTFAAGFSDEWAERFPQRLSQPVALFVSGWYAQDQFKPATGLTLTLGLRMEHNSNPLCRTNCVSNYSNDYNKLPNTTDAAYNTIFASGREKAYFEQQDIAWEPRFGFSYQPGGAGGKTTIRGGFGMFADYFPAQIMGNLVTNIPNVNRFTVLGLAFGNPIPMDTANPNSGHAQASISNDALRALYDKGACYKGCDPSLSLFNVTGGIFSRPTVTGTARKVFLPTYEEWSFAVERELVRNTVLALNYVGNRSYHQPVSNSPNANDPSGSIASLPTSRPNKALGSSTEFYNGSYSNFNGLIATLNSRVGWLTTHFNYAYGHALDTTSNGGFDAFGVNANGQINPYNLRQQYGNADYDTRHYISANYVIAVPYKGEHAKVLLADWEVAGTIFHNTGYPFSVTDADGSIVYGASALAKQTGNGFNHHCGGGKHTLTPCDFAPGYTTATDFGQQGRNQLFGPNYTDFDLDIAKGFRIPRWEAARLKVGAQFFNTFNHPNFQIPLNDVTYGSSNGLIYTTANTPTSILGAFLGGDASPRLIQLKGSFIF